MIVLPVWVTLPDGRTLAVGTLACSEPDEAGRFESEFAYDDGWLRDRDCFPLDPLSLPLGAGRFHARQLEPPLAVFDDALPDDWGRELIVRSRRLPHRQQGAPYLLKVMAEHGLGLGALSFSESSRSNRLPLPAARTSLARLAVAAEAVRRASAAPRQDVDQLFRLMTFNAALGNTDDHLKNFWMVHDDAGYRVSEAFDLLPDVGERREHCLAFEYARVAPTRAELTAVAGRWGVRDAASIIDAVVGGVAAFAAVAKSRRVPKANIDEILADFGQASLRVGEFGRAQDLFTRAPAWQATRHSGLGRRRTSNARSSTARSATSRSRRDCLVSRSPSRVTVRTGIPSRSIVSAYGVSVS